MHGCMDAILACMHPDLEKREDPSERRKMKSSRPSAPGSRSFEKRSPKPGRSKPRRQRKEDFRRLPDSMGILGVCFWHPAFTRQRSWAPEGCFLWVSCGAPCASFLMSICSGKGGLKSFLCLAKGCTAFSMLLGPDSVTSQQPTWRQW